MSSSAATGEIARALAVSYLRRDMYTASVVILLFSVATATAIAVRSIRFPYTMTLVLVGLAIGAFHIVEAPHLTKDLLFAVILPGLLFEASFNVDAKEFWASRLTIASLAAPAVVAAIVLTALLVVAMMAGFALDPSFDWRYGLVFGSLIAATDPISVPFTLILTFVSGATSSVAAFPGGSSTSSAVPCLRAR